MEHQYKVSYQTPIEKIEDEMNALASQGWRVIEVRVGEELGVVVVYERHVAAPFAAGASAVSTSGAPIPHRNVENEGVPKD